MEQSAGWIAPIATPIAAMITAGNLGTPTTGWGFVIVTVGSLGWIVVAMTTGQPDLWWSNACLTMVDMMGIWRWLERRVRVDDSAAAVSLRLFGARLLEEVAVRSRDGATVASAVDAMAGCRNGRIDDLPVGMDGVGGVGEMLCRLPWVRVRMAMDGSATDYDADAVRRMAAA